jgi:hypothetical protein
MTSRLLTVDAVRAKSKRSISIRDNVEEIYSAITREILESEKNGLGELSFKVPAQFDIPQVSNAKAQLHIYTELIRKLESGGFRVQINRNNGCWMISGWESTGTDSLDRELLNILASRTV